VDPPQRRHAPGALRLSRDGVVARLLPDDLKLDNSGLPPAVASLGGRTEAGDIVMMDIRSRGLERGSLDVAEYRATSLLVDLDLRDVENDAVVGVYLEYGGLSEWQSKDIYEDDMIIEDGEYVGWRAELRYAQDSTVQLDEGFTLRWGSAWSVQGAFDRRTFATPIRVGVASESRRPIGDHLVRLDAIHALLNVAHRGQVESLGGSAKLGSNSTWCEFWQTDMMSPDAEAAGSQSFPHFGLDDIGGITTVANWVKLVLSRRRAVAPLVRHTLVQNQTPESRLLSTAAAMEYWVAVNRRSAAWARKTADDLPAALARKVHSSWRDWIGHSDEWVTQFWAAYNELKHDPGKDLDPQIVHALEVSGRWLLTASLLDESAGTYAPSQHIFGTSLPLQNVGAEIRDLLRLGPA